MLLIVTPAISAKEIELDSDYCDWYFSIGKNKKQYMAIVPGSNINDLLCNQVIPNPYTDNNLSNVKWVEDSSFTYVTTFNLQVRAEYKYEILFEGLDTYAEVYLNNQLILKSNNMFVGYQQNITKLLRDGTNLLKIYFKSAVEVGKQKALRDKIKYPADNEEDEIKVSPFIRKAAFQFGWDINPRLLSCGIWRPIKIISSSKNEVIVAKKNEINSFVKPFYKLRKEKDNTGESFAFYTNDKKSVQTFMFGANYVPYNMYPLPIKQYKRVAHLQKNQALPNRHEYYHQLFSELKNYGVNMLRIWGGGWYEDDYFYELADSMKIAIWQDFMFANTMYPGDEEFINSVKDEVKFNIERLSKHPCIVLWSGNNEIEVAWKNWGWQTKYQYTYADSLKLINDYKLLFESIIPNELKLQKSTVPYIPSSPLSNWGKLEDFTRGDNHYWGIWHGEAPIKNFLTHIPRFASEYGLPSLGVNSTLNKFNSRGEAQNKFIWNRMKSYKGMKLLNQYITDCLPLPINDSALSYASRFVQYKALKTAYNAHLYNFPYCSGSLFWQFNESWPGITWAAIDFSGQRKIPPYQSNFSVLLDDKEVIKIKCNVSNNNNLKASLIEFSLKDISGKMLKKHAMKCNMNEIKKGIQMNPYLYFDSLNLKQGYLIITLKNIETFEESIIWDTLVILKKEKQYELKKPTFSITKIDEHHIKITANQLVLGLFIENNGNPKIKCNQNFINLEAGEAQLITFDSDISEVEMSSFYFFSVYDLLQAGQ
jgi:beta-mannosidase